MDAKTRLRHAIAELQAIVASEARQAQVDVRPTLEYGKRYVYRGLPEPTGPLTKPHYRQYKFEFMDPNTGNVFMHDGRYHPHSPIMDIKSMCDLVGEYNESPTPTRHRLTGMQAAQQREIDFWSRHQGPPDDPAPADPAPVRKQTIRATKPKRSAPTKRKSQAKVEQPFPVKDYGSFPAQLQAFIEKNRRRPQPKPEPVTEEPAPKPTEPEEPAFIPAVKICTKCKRAGCVPTERFCTKCRKSVVAKNKSQANIPIPKRQYRSREQQENTYETKFGSDY